MAMSKAARAFQVQQFREQKKAQGYRYIQLLVPDTRLPGYAEECRRQSRLVAKSNEADTELQQLMEEAAASIEGWTA